ncbi:CU044_5270 family protein [Streptomyces sp. LP05-1]|uniref:CU044_5270 family protein n=1 Tax=Streptomyces pyxinae TaxID=2970734 RepID=A0ABT2CBE3_9ACTN|nr:CU044_5270 family protein [Streptomyces sp. LP05-1]MCS0634736.1 CU044_5270 family protein [Streptomyces sp. LP05-1]
MNDIPDIPDVEELARLLPEPVAPELPRRAHDLHRERLMRLIDQDGRDHRAHQDSQDRRDRQDSQGRRGRRGSAAPAAVRWPVLRRPAVLLPAAGVAVAGALTAALALGPPPVRSGTAEAGTPAGPPAAEVVLDRASTVALATDTDPVGEDSFVYVRSMVREADLTSGKPVLGPLHQREVWRSQRPGRVTVPGHIRENGEMSRMNAEFGDTGGTPVGVNRPTYRWLAELPREPAALLRRLRELTPVEDGQEQDQAVFEQIGYLVGEQVMPPETAAALYRAAARIPGVRSAADASDATGRHGVGIVRDDTRSGERSEWVFGKDSSFLGSRTYLSRDTALGPAGTLLSADAVQERGVVAEAGDRPS